MSLHPTPRRVFAGIFAQGSLQAPDTRRCPGLRSRGPARFLSERRRSAGQMDLPGSRWLDRDEPYLGELRISWRNSTESRLDLFPHGKLLLLEVLMVLMCVGAVMGNILVIVIVVATKTFHSVTSVLIINLAISDFLVGIGVMPFVAVSLINDGWVNCTDLCLYVGYTSSVYCTASVLTLAAIAMDRYYSIVDCLRYNSRCTAWRTGAAVLWIWLQAVLTSSPPLLGWSDVSFVAPMYSCAVNWASSPSYTVFMAVFSFLLPAAVILFCYVKIVRVARHHARRIRDLREHFRSVPGCPGAEPETHDPSRLVCYVSGSFVSEDLPGGPARRTGGSGRRRRRLHTFLAHFQSGDAEQVGQPQHHGVLRLFMVIAAFFLCWTPYMGVALVQSVSQVPSTAVTFSYWLVLFNSDLNPLLYALLSKRFQGALQNLRRKIQARVRGERRADAGRASPSADVRGQPDAGARRAGSGLGSEYSSVFTINAAFPKTEEPGEVLLPGSASTSSFSTSSSSCSLWRDCGGGGAGSLGGSGRLRVPSVPREPERGGGASPVGERQATFFYGQITVRVEHDVC
ncbi:5-hydroxytryptamine receptor 1F [Trichomycterus rosablanca]|uniref:5-hydroxytryptamine receptor 1F n=1 Tax=Trichomycterus rosablanca TaxID=2290929 RepID=UPI002F3570B2